MKPLANEADLRQVLFASKTLDFNRQVPGQMVLDADEDYFED